MAPSRPDPALDLQRHLSPVRFEVPVNAPLSASEFGKLEFWEGFWQVVGRADLGKDFIFRAASDYQV